MNPADLVKLADGAGVRLWVEDGALRFRSTQGRLSEELRAKLAANRDELIRWLVESGRRTAPLSFNQTRLFLIDEIDRRQSTYNMAVAFRSRSRLPVDKLERAVRRIVRRHESLRSRLQVVDGEPRQVILAPQEGSASICVQQVAAPGVEAEQWLAEEVSRRFDLSNSPPLRVCVREESDGAVILFAFHHLFFDGGSYHIFFEELNALLEDEEGLGLAPATLQYSDYVRAERDEAARERARSYWETYLAEAPTLTSLPTDRPRIAPPDHRGATLVRQLAASEVARLEGLAGSLGSSLFVTLSTLFAAFLSRWTGRSDLIVGSPFEGRDLPGADRAIGFFSTLLPLRFRLSEDPTLAEMIGRTSRSVADAFAHLHVPFEQVVRTCGLSGRADSNPLIQTVFALEHGDGRALTIDNEPLDRIVVSRSNVNFEVEVMARRTADGLVLTWTYAESLFDRATVEAAANAFHHLLGAEAIDGETLLSALPLPAGLPSPILPAAGEHELLLHSLGRHAEAAPDRDIYQAGDSFTMGRLAAASGRVAEALREVGAPAGATVTLRSSTPSPATLAVVVGAWRARMLVRLTPVRHEKGESDVKFSVQPKGGESQPVHLDLPGLIAGGETDIGDEEAVRALQRDAALVSGDSEALAFEELPNSAPLTHHALARLLGAVARRAEVTGEDTVAVTAASWQEASLLQAWLGLATGARLALPGPAAQAGGLVERLASCRGANVFHLPGRAVELAVEEGWRPAAGSVFIFEHSLPSAQTIDVLARLCPEHVGLLVTGRTFDTPFTLLAAATGGSGRGRQRLAPLPGTQCQLLDVAVDRVAAPGAVGEVAVLVAAAPGGWCRTGIIATRTGDGFLRPCDTEEALLIDPPSEDEVRSAAATFPAIASFEVELRTAHGHRQLIASVGGEELDLAGLDRHLALHLRPHWRPTLQASPSPRRNDSRSRRAEDDVRAAWEQVLGSRPEGMHTNFFSAGGHSLLAVRLANALARRIGHPIAPLQVFEHPTLAALTDLIVAAAEGSAGRGTEAERIPRLGSDVAPLSKQQLRLWAADRMGLSGGRQTVPLRYEICGRIPDPGALAAAFDDLMARHDSLRTTFEGGTGAPRQVVHPPIGSILQTLDLRGWEESLARSSGQAFERSILAAGFDLESGSVFQAGLVTYSDERHVLCINAHHIVTDAWSTANMIRDLRAFYEGRLNGVKPDLPVLELQYNDYAAWQAAELGRSPERGMAYWHERLEATPHDHGLETFPRPERPGRAAATLATIVDEEQAAALESLAARAGTTLFVLISTALAGAVAKLSGRDSVVLGTPTANRHPGELEPLVGLFVETMPMLFRLRPGESLEAAVARSAGEIAQDRAHHDIPFGSILRAAGIRPEPSRHPLFQITVTEADSRLDQFDLGEAHATFAGGSGGEARFDLTLTFHRRRGRGLALFWTYAEDIFDRDTIGRIASALEEILGAPAVLPNRRRGSAMPSADAAGQPGMSSLLAMFDGHVLESPGAPACRWLGRSLSYGELGSSSWRIGGALAALGVEAEQGVALLFDRTGAALAGMLGALRAGAAYVPLEPQHPTARLRTILEDSGAPVLLADEASLRRHGWSGGLSGEGLERLLPEGCACLIVAENGSVHALGPAGHAASSAVAPPSGGEAATGATLARTQGGLAYILYTSGTTGRPRGVLVEQEGVRNYLNAQSRFLGLAGIEKIGDFLCLTSFAFDTCVSSVWGALGSGRCVYLASEDERYDPDFVADALCRPDRYAVAYVPPALLAELPLPEGAALVKRIVVSGEAAAADLVSRLAGRTGLYNEYGPTETTVGATVHRFDPSDKPARIGRPIDGVTVFVRRADGGEAGEGEEGELWIGGAGVSRGYINAPELTAERFDVGADGDRRYRTGDWVCRLAGGDLMFLGRRDNQVKLRGQRLELGEIAAHLEEVEGVRGALVRVRKAANGREQLAAYLLLSRAHEDRHPAVARAARDALRMRLPAYMVPALWSVLHRWPLTTNGKIDEASLPEPLPLRASDDPAQSRVGTRDGAIAETLADLWEGLLGARPQRDSHFFDAGGDSITALQLVARAAEKGVRIAVQDVMRAGTLEAIAELAEREDERDAVAAAGPDPAGGEILLPLLPMQREFLERATPAQRDHFNQAMLLTSKRKLTASALRAAVAKLIARHEVLRLRFEEGPDGWQARLTDDVEEDAISSAVRLVLPDLDPKTIEAACDVQHRSLNVRFGPLFRIALLDHAEGQRLLLTFHHLIVDAVSWPLILADLATALSGSADAAGKRASSRYVQAVRSLGGIAGRPEVQAEIPFWRAAVARSRPLEAACETKTSAAARTGGLDAAATRSLIDRARPGSAGLDVVLAGVAVAARRCGFAQDVAVPLSIETHGRAAFDRDIDVSTTVGWFSSTYPIAIELPPEDPDPFGTALEAARKALDSAPAGGAHYEILRDSGALGEIVAEPGLLLNYFGRHSPLSGTAGETLFEKAPEPLGTAYADVPMRPRDATIVCGIVGDRLEFTIVPGAGRLSEKETETLAAALSEALYEAAGAAKPEDEGQAGSSWAEQVGATVSDAWLATGMQQGLLFEEQVRPGIYLTRMQLTFRNAVGDHLREAFAALIGRHASLRSCFRPDEGGTPHQIVLEQVDIPWRSTDLRHLPSDEREARIAAVRKEEAAASLDLSTAPLLRIHELLIEPDTRLVLWSVHHSCIDGWSLPILIRELCELHDAYAAHRTPSLPPAPSFGTFARWVHAQDPEQSLSHWRSRLAGVLEATPLPMRPQTLERDGHDKLELDWDLESSRSLIQAASRYRCTAATLLRAAWGALLARYAGRADVLFGMVVAGRPPQLPEAQRTVGLFINTVPARVRIDPSQPIEAWLDGLQQESVEDMQHAFLPIRSVEGLVPGLAGRLFRSILAVENYPVERHSDERERDGLRLQAAAADEQTNFDLSLQAQLSDRLRLRLSYATPAFSEPLARKLMGDFERLLMALCRGGSAVVGDLPIRPSLAETTGRSDIAPAGTTSLGIARRFAVVARATPDAIAVEHNQRQASYAELDRHSDGLARELAALGAGTGHRIGIRAPRGVDAVAAMLAVLKIGGAYVPIDPRFPTARVRDMLEQAAARFLLTPGTEAGAELPGIVRIDTRERDEPWIAAEPAAAEPDDPAYVMFTSGSTGQPKGVVVPHRSVERLVIDPDYVELGPTSRIAHVSNPAFDASTFEIWGALLNGGCLVVLDDGTVQDTGRFGEALDEARVGTLFLTTALLDQIVALRPESFACLDQLLFGGEAVDPRTVETLLASAPPRRLIHVYGPTENTTFSTAYEISRVAPSYPIGRFINGTSGAVLSVQGLPVPPGEVGELYLCGAGLALGYAGRTDLTQERFLILAGASPEMPFYRTGDLVQATDTGALTFVGRIDRQVKVRGFRIEPDEVRLQLLAAPGIADAHVFTVGEAGCKQLAAAVVPTEDARDRPPEGTSRQQELEASLRERLPAYMVPSAWLLTDGLPLTPNGKVDENGLRRRLLEKTDTVVNANLPRDSIEMGLYKIWGEVLRAQHVSVEDDFFSVGGTSISAIRLRHRIQQVFGIDVALAEFLKSPTIASVAARIRDGRRGTPAAEPQRIVTFKEGAGGTDVVCVHPAGGTAFTYLPLARALPDSHRVVGIQAFGVERDEPLPSSIESMAESYLARMADEDRPRIYVGASFGGLVAYEMARQQAARGKPAGAVMLDSQATDDPKLLATIKPVTLEVFRQKLVKYSGMYPGISDEEIDRYFRLYNHHLMLMKHAGLKLSTARTVLVLATGDKVPAHQQAMIDYWRRRAGDLHVEKVGGDHSTVIEPPQLSTVVALIREEARSIAGQGVAQGVPA
jgi:amino acid adenylation domain-containing protein